MAIIASELKLYKSAVITDTSANGGRRGTDVIVSGTLGNYFPHVLPEERESGSNKVRKCFYSVQNDDDLPLYSSKLFLDAPTPGQDWVTMFSGTHRDTVASHSSPRRYGVAFLSANANAGASTLIVTVEDATIAGIYANGDEIIITDKATATASAGNRELHTISGVPVVVGAQVTITIAGTLANAYTTANNARVASVIVGGDLACLVDNWVETSAAGTYDETTYPVTTDNMGTIEQTWTLTFSDATTFTVVGDVVGSVGSGTTASNFAPVNSASKPYFTLASAGWGGTWANGNTIVFQTHPPDLPFYLNRVIPAAAAAQAGNRITPVLLGATA
jgi:hypothetical protein